LHLAKGQEEKTRCKAGSYLFVLARSLNTAQPYPLSQLPRFDQSDGSISPLDRKCKGFQINAGYNWVHGRARAFLQMPKFQTVRILVQTYKVSRLQKYWCQHWTTTGSDKWKL